MAGYQSLRSAIQLGIETQFGPSILEGYTWDPLPASFPCTASCMAEHRTNRSRREVTPAPLGSQPAVLYLPLGGGGSRGCPSLAESSVVGISQMVFLWTVMSVFNVVANVVASVNNNQNNRNNNNNNLQINKISTQNTQISANTNNANTISIMLPPPIPVLAGGRQLDAQQRLKRFVERERKIKKRQAEESEGKKLKVEGPEVTFQRVAVDIIQHIVTSQGELGLPGREDCLGRHLCHLSRTSRSDTDHLETVALKLATFALLWVQLEDDSSSFSDFLNNITRDDFDETLDCDLIFYKCN